MTDDLEGVTYQQLAEALASMSTQGAFFLSTDEAQERQVYESKVKFPMADGRTVYVRFEYCVRREIRVVGGASLDAGDDEK